VISQRELDIMVKQTAHFIAADPETIVVTPEATRESDGAGGTVKVDGMPYDQVVRLIPQSDKVPVVSTFEGTREKVEYILIALPEQAEYLQAGAVFYWRNQHWLISQTHDKPDYEHKADVVLNVG
jgi:hypothetical protein